MHPKELRYSREHFWVKEEVNGELRLGLTDFYQGELHTIVYIELPQPGQELALGQPCGSLESSKTACDLVSPLSGRVTEVNPRVAEKPGLINHDPYGEGWLLVIKPNQPEEMKTLMPAESYLKSVPPAADGSCQG
jgi:glycine cleavage system H protein